MIYYLKYKNEKIIEFEALVFVNGITILENTIKILNEEHLPVFLKNSDNLYIDLAVWLENRKMRVRYAAKEDGIYTLYNGKSYGGDRLGNMTFGISFLNHLISWFDEYSIDSDSVKAFYFGMENPDFLKLFFFTPRKEFLPKKHPQTEVDIFFSNIYETSPPQTFNTYSFGVPSNKISFWEEQDGKILLTQMSNFSDDNDEEAIEILKRNKYPPNITSKKSSANSRGNVRTRTYYSFDYTEYVGVEVTWLFDYLEKAKYEKDEDWPDYLFRKYPELNEAKDTIFFLKNIEEEFYKNRVPINVNKIGIGLLNGKYVPVVIL